MTSAGGWAPEPVFGDALAGPGGMGEPPRTDLFGGDVPSEVFPDALSGVLLPGAADEAITPPRPPLLPPGSGRVGASTAPARRQPVQSRTPPRPWTQQPSPGGTPPRPVPNPTVGYVPLLNAAPGNAGLIRPPAYLPQPGGMAQLRAAAQQAGRSTVAGSRAAASATARKWSGVWGVLLALVIVLLATGVLEKIITAISHLLQGT